MLNYQVMRKRLEKIARAVNPARYRLTAAEQQRLREILALKIPFEDPEYPRREYMQIVHKVIIPAQHVKAVIAAWKEKETC